MSDSTSTPRRMTSGDDMHLTLLMTPHGLNFVTGQDRQHLLAFGRAAFEAGKVAAAAQQGAQDAEPAAWVATFKPEGLLALHSVVGANLEELKQSVPGNSVFRPLYTHPSAQGLDAQQLHNDIMNLPAQSAVGIPNSLDHAYALGHRDARHAAAKLVLATQAKQAEALQASRSGGCGCCSNACADRSDGCRFVHESPGAADMAAAQAKQGGA